MRRLFSAMLWCAAVGCSRSPGAGAGSTSASGASNAAPDPKFMIFLLVGQSNMEGIPKPEPPDQEHDRRVKVLAFDDCAFLGRHYGQWYTAAPPLHGCRDGVGPGDYFGKTLARAFPDATIGLVPCGIGGVDIDFFRKGVVSKRRKEFRIPPDDHWSGAYDWVLERARLAARSGVLRGVVFHQGESDTADPAWVEKVKGMVRDLRADLGVADAPFVAGELLYGACCDRHNPLVNRVAVEIPNARVVSAAGLHGMDSAHFDLEGQRELGRRYASAMIELLRR